MGQKISALKRKVRSLKKYSQRKSDTDGYLSQITSSKADCAVLPLKLPDSKEEARLQSNISGSLSQPASFKGEYTVVSSKVMDSKEVAQRQSDIDGILSQTTPLEGDCAVLSSRIINNKEDTPHQRNADESLLPTSSAADEYATPSLSITDSWEGNQSEIDINETFSPTTSSRDLFAALLSRINSCKSTRSQIDIHETFSPTASSSRDLFPAPSSSMFYSCTSTQSHIDIDEILSRTTSDDLYASLLTAFINLDSHPRHHIDLDGYYSQMESRDDKRAMLSSNGKRGVQLGSIRNSSEDSHLIGISEVDTVPKTLLKLSTDLILEIADYLPPSSYMSLSYTCRRIRNGMGASILNVLGDAPSVEMRNVQSLERIEWRQMLDRDRTVPSPRAFCSGCLYRHDRSLFAIKSLTKPSTKRRCVGSAGRIWICPHLALDIDQMKYLRRSERFKLVECQSTFFDAITTLSPVCSRFISHSIFTQWPIMPVSPKCQPLNEEVKEALGPLNAPICPHLRLNHARVASLYFQDCRNLRRTYSKLDCQCLICSSRNSYAEVCAFCDTRINFTIKCDHDGLGALVLYIQRFIKTHVDDCTDRNWICHVADPADFKEYKEAWDAAVAECWRRVEPVARRTSRGRGRSSRN